VLLLQNIHFKGFLGMLGTQGFARWFKRLVILGIALIAIGWVAAYIFIVPNLPNTDELKSVQLQVPLKIYSRDGFLIAEYGEKKRTPLKREEIPDQMVYAFLSAEDGDFYSHLGVDFFGLLRAGLKLIVTGERRQGGSTITMQVARNFYLTRKKTYLRKLYEIFLSFKIERDLTKDEILMLYLNKIYLGARAYGVGAASLVYYGRLPHELTLAETATIAGLPKAPSTSNPLANPAYAEQRRNYVLHRMLELGHITQAQHDEAVAADISTRRHAPIELEAPYVAEMVRAEMVNRYGNDAYTSGYKVYTSILSKNQLAANLAIRDVLDDYALRHGYQGAETNVSLDGGPLAWNNIIRDTPTVGNLIPALVTRIENQSAQLYLGDGQTDSLTWEGMKWARAYINQDAQGPAPKTAADVLKEGDVIRVVRHPETQIWQLTQIPKASAALISLNARDGSVLSLVGGYDFYSNNFNRVTQALRQPGSGFKPFIYSAALEKGFTPASLVNDAPVVFEDAELESAWRPENYSGKFFGPTRVRFALTKSRNLVSIRLLRTIGLKHALDHARNFGFEPAELPNNLSLSLGSANVTPWQMAKGYAVLANGGFLVEPYFIDRIEQGDNIIEQATPAIACDDCTDSPEIKIAPRTLSPQNRFLMYSMMQDVIQEGTGQKAKALNRNDIAGKTGTTNDQRDAWFNGFNQSVVTNVWVGFDDNGKLGQAEFGGKTALPAWVDYMRVALADSEDEPPHPPEGIVTVNIDPKTGLRVPAEFNDAIFEYFRESEVPALLSEQRANSAKGTPNASRQGLF
jgi:penicillin-binding protein 1A